MSETKPENKKYTPEEFDNLIKDSAIKYEYHNGHIRAMAGARPNHNILSANCTTLLNNALSEKGCIVFSSDQSINIADQSRYVYPDVSMACEEPDFERNLHLNNPSLIIEVASESTKEYDRSDKLAFYFSLPSLKEYIIVSSDKAVVVCHSKNSNNEWVTKATMGMKSTISLINFDMEISMKDIYKNISNLPKII